MTAPPETAPLESAIASLRTRVHVLQTARAAQLENARTAAEDQAALESSLMKNLAAGTDTAKLEASLARAEAERAAALRKVGLLDPAIREAEAALLAASRQDEAGALRLALEADQGEIPRLREETEQALRTLTEAFQKAHRLHVESAARLKRLETLAPGAPGFDLECSPHLSPGATLRPAEERLRQELYDANKRYVLIPVQVPLALD